jgi:VWFA-related protein
MRLLALAVLVTLFTAAVPSMNAQAPAGQPRPMFRANTQLVSVDVIVRDGSGTVVRGLTAADFEVLEDGKPQEIRSFSFEEISDHPKGVESAELLAGAQAQMNADSRAKTPAPAASTPSAATSAAEPEAAPKPMTPEALAGRRLIVLLFDIASMQPEDVQRAVDSATKYVDTTMTAADMVAVATISTKLDVLSDFSADKTRVSAALGRLGYTEGTATPPPTASTAATDEQAAADDTSAADTTEMDMFNNDVRLRALKALAETLAPIDQKKAILYFSAGMQRSGEDNQVELRSAINAAVRAHVSIYSVDTRGLQAVVPGGDATRASGRGTALFSGRGVSQQFSQLSASQDTLAALSADTGGRAFMDSNDFAPAFDRVQRDMSAYYLIGYSTANLSKDGRFRTIRVRVKKPNTKVEARGGYFADRDFQHTARTDRETQLQEQLFAAVSATDLPVLVNAGYYRMAADRYYVPLALAVPGSAIPIPAEKDKDKLALDVLGVVQDEQGRPVGRIRQTLNLPAGSTGTLTSRQVLYQSSVTLPPGRFSVKVVVRENTSGLLGSFEAPVVVRAEAGAAQGQLGVAQHAAADGERHERQSAHRNGEQLVPNLTHIIGRTRRFSTTRSTTRPRQNVPAVRTSLAFYRARSRVQRPRSSSARRRRRVAQGGRLPARSPGRRAAPLSTPARSTSSMRSPASSPSRAWCSCCDSLTPRCSFRLYPVASAFRRK